MKRLLERQMCRREIYAGISGGELSAVKAALEQEKIRYRRKQGASGRERLLVRRRDEALARKLVQIEMNLLWREQMRK